jgi:hypothetical protein
LKDVLIVVAAIAQPLILKQAGSTAVMTRRRRTKARSRPPQIA